MRLLILFALMAPGIAAAQSTIQLPLIALHSSSHLQLLRVDRSGRTQWRWDAAPTGRFSHVPRAVVHAGAIYATGTFSRGSFRLPGHEQWRSQRFMTHWVARFNLGTGAVVWANRVPGGIEETDLAVGEDGTLYFATHAARRRAGQDIVVQRLTSDGERLSPLRWGSPVDDHPRAIVAIPAGVAVLVASTRASGGEDMRLVGFAGDQAQFEHTLPDYSTVASGAFSGQVSVLAPLAVREVNRSGLTQRWTSSLYVLGVDGQGRRVSERAIPTAGQFLVDSLRADRSSGSTFVSGVRRRGRGAEVVVLAI